MKKIVLLIVLSLLATTQGHAACVEGTEITGKNGHVYCMSNVGMNWYSAFAWCDVQGRTLATVRQICDIDETQKWTGGEGVGGCLNMVGVSSEDKNVWSAIPQSASHAYVVNLFMARVSSSCVRATSNCHAMCW